MTVISISLDYCTVLPGQDVGSSCSPSRGVHRLSPLLGESWPRLPSSWHRARRPAAGPLSPDFPPLFAPRISWPKGESDAYTIEWDSADPGRVGDSRWTSRRGTRRGAGRLGPGVRQPGEQQLRQRHHPHPRRGPLGVSAGWRGERGRAFGESQGWLYFRRHRERYALGLSAGWQFPLLAELQECDHHLHPGLLPERRSRDPRQPA